MDEVAALLRAQEEALLTTEVRGSRAALEALLLPEFREFGSSGRVFDLSAIIASLAGETAVGVPACVEDFACVMPGAESALVTYRIARAGVAGSLRSSVWVLRAGAWRMLFHQGTRVGGGVDLGASEA